MRTVAIFLVWAALIFPGAALRSQQADVPLAGFKFVRIHPLRFTDGTVDPWRLAPYLEELLVKQGWTLLRGTEDLLRPDAREMASQTMQCVIGIDTAGWGTSSSLRCADVAGQEIVNISGKGVAVTEAGEMRAAVRDLAKRLQTVRPQFDARQTVDILSRLPRVDTYPLTEVTLDEMARTGKLNNPVEGLWATTDETGYRLGIVSNGGEFVVVMLDSPKTFAWQPGMVKGRLLPGADNQSFAARWRMGDRTEASGVAILSAGTLNVTIRRDGNDETVRLLKLKPSRAGTDPSASGSIGTGTGFFCAPGILATNHHVIEGAQKIELYLPAQRRWVPLQLLVSDSTNDLALLRVDDSVGEVPPPLRIVDSSEVRLGSEALVIGFPLSEALGSDHKVTSGLVSGLDGLNGDPRMLQLTAPIQPGSSGSPVFDNRGRVLGVVTGTLNFLTALRASGQVPQNVNFAMKADYLALLLKRVITPPKTTGPDDAPMTLPDLIEKVRVSVGQIRAIR